MPTSNIFASLAKRSRKTSATKPTKQRKRKQKNSSDDDDNDVDSDEPALTSLHNPDVPCAAQKKCRKPQSANVEWVSLYTLHKVDF